MSFGWGRKGEAAAPCEWVRESGCIAASRDESEWLPTPASWWPRLGELWENTVLLFMVGNGLWPSKAMRVSRVSPWLEAPEVDDVDEALREGRRVECGVGEVMVMVGACRHPFSNADKTPSTAFGETIALLQTAGECYGCSHARPHRR